MYKIVNFDFSCFSNRATFGCCINLFLCKKAYQFGPVFFCGVAKFCITHFLRRRKLWSSLYDTSVIVYKSHFYCFALEIIPVRVFYLYFVFCTWKYYASNVM
jgi:hypothetical protein